ncbi:methionyl-tRNA formyltransferase [Carboxydochorda subterranea]|uniref:Methionyl-tRNA formyltransferase n=1 Tax=Carboxydichorda subterranea TaxID=3109565 RepID=A0ABZ1C285_9FIRM|nr:methionyl-tRNA formyltransferase [Limnochorda sp. L945t]WRP18915.1 methionyl-tRNA formyltransferase [Limnochorda sp. L945t]
MFAGTPEFAVPSLRALARAGHAIPLVMTQPDRPKGRGMRPAPPPVKVEAQALGLQIWQPEHLEPHELTGVLRSTGAEALVVVAYAHKIPAEVLGLPRYGCINVHASLLPRWRGAAPIAWALLEGDRVTGVTIMRMDEGWDTGPILLQRAAVIGPEETAASLHDRLSETGAELLVEAVARLEAGTLQPIEQPEEGVRLAPRLQKEQGRVDWTQPAERIARRCRAFYPWPGCFTTHEGRLIKVVEARVAGQTVTGRRPGEVLGVEPGAGVLRVACGDGTVLSLARVQPEGSRSMTGLELWNGLHLEPGSILGA